MAVYKVIQDIEAEDKIVGFLSLKSFIYALIACALAYINVRFLMAGSLGPLRFVFILIFMIPMLVFGILAAPLGRDQPTEVWILSHIKFFLNPRMRIWDQSGAQELVTITVPRKIVRDYTKGLSQQQVRSRLKALATTLDSRGWAVKNVAVDLNANPSYLDVAPDASDRLVSAASVTKEQDAEVHASDDIMDGSSNPTAQHFDSLMQEAESERKQKVINKLNEARQEKKEAVEKAEQMDTSFIDQSVPEDQKDDTEFYGHKVINSGSEEFDDERQANNKMGNAEQNFLNRLHQKAEVVHAKSSGFKPGTQHHKPKAAHHHKENNHSEAKEVSAEPKTEAPPPNTEAPRPAQNEINAAVTAELQNAKLKELIEVAKHDKLSTLAKEANRNTYRVTQTGPNELEIDLR
jgi:hypothetical protein